MLRSETGQDLQRAAAALAGLRAYQTAVRPPPCAMPPIVATVGRARLLDYGGSGRPVVFVPSLINGRQVLDLLPDQSLLHWLAEQGVHPLVVDWESPGDGERNLSIAGHIETLLLPLLRSISDDHVLAGYCLGGTMALAAAALRPPTALALIATPWHFSGFPEDGRRGLAALWSQARQTADVLGLLPLEVLQAGFWQLDPRRTIDKFVRFGEGRRTEQVTRLFVALEDWANDGPPLTCAAGEELIESLFGDDVTGRGTWRVGGRAINPRSLGCPVLDIVSSTDRIVPAASATGIGRRITLRQGHVGMIVGGHARAALWQPLAEWLLDPDFA